MIAIEPAPSKNSAADAAIRRRDLSRFLSSALKAIGLSGKVSVLLTGDERVRALNREFRGYDKATDVLSFPASLPFAAGGHLGDLAISLETASRQAAGFGHPLQTEVKILLLHGLLHLAGEDHETDSGEMARREMRLRKKLDLPLGLIERSHLAAAPRRKAGPKVAETAMTFPKARNIKTRNIKARNSRSSGSTRA